MIQGTQEWLEWRKTRGGASEVAALMGCSPWFPRTPYELWQVKKGLIEIHENEAMRRGLELEDSARRYAEELLGDTFEPQALSFGRIVASLDGISFDGNTIIEIKCPAKGEDSDLWKHIEEYGEPPKHYWWQCQQQLYVSGAGVCKMIVAHEEQGAIVDALTVDIEPCPDSFVEIHKVWTEFFGYLDSDTPPPLTDADVRKRDDDEWQQAAQEWQRAKQELDAAKQAESAARDRLIDLAGEHTTEGANVRVSRYYKAGGTDYRKLVEDAGLNPQGYEKQGKVQYRITEQKE